MNYSNMTLEELERLCAVCPDLRDVAIEMVQRLIEAAGKQLAQRDDEIRDLQAELHLLRQQVEILEAQLELEENEN